MKTLLIIDANLGQARAYMAKTLLGAAARLLLELLRAHRPNAEKSSR